MYTDDKHYTTKAEIMETLKDDETVYSRQTGKRGMTSRQL